MKKTIGLFLVIFSLASPVLFAEDAKLAEPAVAATETIEVVETGSNQGSCVSCPAEKLGRGVSNLAYSPFEIPYRIGKEMEVQNPVGAFTTGSLKGIFWFGARALVGAVETVTFFIPTKPMMGDYDAGWWAA